MGLLADTRNRRKISQDPNNTKWTRDTTTFGQRILRSQGWLPGQFLGASDAPHADLHTSASASYIRVAMKDDTKGLGLDKAREDEVTGLDVFSDLLSRLNGKSADVVLAEKQNRLRVQRNQYIERKYGLMRFVKGELLVGDREGEAPMEEGTGNGGTEKSSRKRKAEDLETGQSEKTDRKSHKSKKAKKSITAESTGENTTSSGSATKKTKKAKASKKTPATFEPTILDRDVVMTAINPDEPHVPSQDDSSEPHQLDKRKEAKEGKRKKHKDKKKSQRAAAADGAQVIEEENNDGPGAVKVETTVLSTPPTSGTSTPLRGRNFVRSRFIAQKKQAVLSPQALDQIFMLKT